MKKLYILLAIASLSVFAVKAQDYSQMIMTGDTPQANMLNPGYMPKSSFMVVPIFGNLAFRVTNSFSLNNIVKDKKIHLNNISDNSHANIALNLDVINFGVRFKKNNLITLSTGVKTSADLMYPTGAFGFIQNNSLEHVGAFDIDFASAVTTWSEIAVGYTRVIDKNWSAGIKVKHLIGVIGASSNSTNFQLDKTAIDSYTIKGDADIMIGGYDVKTSEMYADKIMDNRGWAFDFGAFYKSDDNRWSAGISVLDLGSISWKNGSRIKSVDPNKTYTFSGFEDLEETLDGGDLSSAMDEMIDEMTDALELDTTNVSFRKAIPTTIHAGGSYKVDEAGQHTVTGNFLARVVEGSLHDYSTTIGYTYSNKRKNLKLMGSLINRKYDPISLGLGVMTCSDGFQFYIMTETSMKGLVNFANTRSVGFRMGLNILFRSNEQKLSIN